MKKTLTANISGTVFHVEEDAYDRLSRYLANIRAQFAGIDGRDEIMSDIEARIAELLQERLGTRQVVGMADVEHVVSTMGQPEDYMDQDTGEEHAGPSAAQEERRTHDGGRKRLFRDPDDKWIGGVLGGIGAYFNTDPLWMRIAFICVVIFGIGSPILIYLLLWILIPVADTPAERLMMQGEPVTVDNLKKAFQEGAERFKRGAEQVASEADELGKRWSGPEGRHYRERATTGARRAAHAAGSVAAKVIGTFLLILGAVLTISLLTALVTGGTLTYSSVAGMSGTGLFQLAAAVFDTAAQGFWFTLCALLLALVPAIALFLAGLRLVAGLRSPAWLAWTLSGAWVVAFVVVLVIGVRLGTDFSHTQALRDEAPLQQPAGQVLYLDAMDLAGERNWNVGYSHGAFSWDLDGVIGEDSIHLDAAVIDVEQSPDTLYHLVVERRAQARSTKGAVMRAGNIRYHLDQQDSLLRMSPWVESPLADKMRGQRVRFVVQVPVGRAVHFGGLSAPMLDDVDNVTNTWDRDMVGRTWTMTTGGLSDSVRPEDVPDDLPARPHPASPAPEAALPSAPTPPVRARTPIAMPDLLGLLRLR